TDTNGDDGWSSNINLNILDRDSMLEVIAVDINNIESEHYILNIRIRGLPDWLTTFAEIGYTITDDGKITFEKEIPDPPIDKRFTIPEDIPIIGGEQRFEVYSTFKIIYDMPERSAFVAGEGVLKVKKLGTGAEGSMGLEGNIDMNTFELKDARVFAHIEIIAIRKTFYKPIPKLAMMVTTVVSVYPQIGLSGDIATDPNIHLTGGTISPGMGIAGNSAAEVIGNLASAELGVRGDAIGHIDIPAPHNERMELTLTICGKVEVLWWDHDIGPFTETHHFPEHGRARAMHLETMKFNEWQPTEKYGRIPLSDVRTDRISKAMIQQVIAPSDYGRLTHNNIEDEAPSVIYIGEERYLVVWSAQCTNKEVQAGHDLFWSIYSIDTSTWSEIQMLTNDNYDDRAPKLSKNGNEVIVVWSRINRDLTNEYITSPFEILPYVEVASNRFTLINNGWSDLTLITNNTELDFGPIINDDFIAWETDRDSNLTTTNDRLVKYLCINTNTTFEIPYASKPSLSSNAIAYFDTKTEEVVFGRLQPELNIISRHTAPNLTDLSLTSYNGEFMLAWADDSNIFYLNPERAEPARLLETNSSVHNVDLMDFGNFELISFTGKLPGDIRQRTSYKIRYNGEWVSERTLVDGTNLTLWQADFAKGVDGFFAVFAGKEQMEDKNDIFYTFHRFAGDLTISSTVNGNHSIGDVVTIDYTIENIGDQTTSNYVVNLYNLNMERISSESFTNNIAPGTHQNKSLTATLDNSGGFILTVEAHPDLDLNNNKAIIRLIHPDVLVSNVFETRINDTLNLTASFENNGSVDATNVGFEFFNGITTLYTGTIDIPANSSINHTFAINVSEIMRNLTSGIMIDFENQILEENEENNILHFRALMPDLSVERGAITAINKGDTVSLRVIVKNKGIGDADANLTLLDQDLNPIKHIEFNISGFEEYSIFKVVETTLPITEWNQVYFISVESKYGDANENDNLDAVNRDKLLMLPIVTFTHYPQVPIIGQNVSFDAGESSDADGNITQYIWNFGDGSNVVVTNISTIEHTFLSDGVYTISLAIVDDEGLTNLTTTNVTVICPYDRPELTSIAVIPDNVVLNVTESQQFTAEAVPIEAYLGGVTWSVDNEIGTGIINATGYFTALTAGNVTVIATSVVDVNITGTATVTVVEPIVEPPEPESITITPDIVPLNVTDTQLFTATVYPPDADQDVTWSVTNETVGTIDATGYFTALAEGNVTVTATSVVDVNITETATVIVTEPANITFSNLVVTPLAGETPLDITATALVTNTGGEAGDFNATFIIEGVIIDYATGALSVGENTTINFGHTLDVAGTYNVTIGALTPTIITVITPPDNFTLTTNTVGGGTVIRNPDQIEYVNGTVVSLTAVPDYGWQFVNWTGDIIGTVNPTNITMDADKTVTATFEHIVVDLPTMSIIPTTNEILEGETVTISITIDNAADIAGGMVTIEFDPSTISVVSIEDGASFTAIAFNYSNTEGFVRMAASSASAIGIDQIIFANITFQGIHPNTSELIFTDARTNCIDGQMSDAAFNNGEITVIPTMPGDLNDDGQLDSGDATLALQMAIGELSENLLGDLNENGRIDTGDATRMLQGSL
ncbi:MAG: PKD domain-containing protein, partial [Methanosarcinales archaeon]|nr:PKD domain-containing protein [Methanosarcinales archaeon]